jgi:hypothetical protein
VALDHYDHTRVDEDEIEQTQTALVRQPVTQMQSLLPPLLVMNKKAQLKARLKREIVSRDLELLVPCADDRATLGPLFVPIARLGIVQLELVLETVMCEGHTNQVRHQARTARAPATSVS